LCCEIFVTKSKLKARLAFGGIFCFTFFREGCSPAARLDLDEPPLLVLFAEGDMVQGFQTLFYFCPEPRRDKKYFSPDIAETLCIK